MPEHHDGILIIDFGSQYTQLIARRVREAHVYCEIHPPTRTVQWIREWKPKGIILSGGPNSVYDDDVPTADPELLEPRHAGARALLRDAAARAPRAAGTSPAPTAGSTAAPASRVEGGRLFQGFGQGEETPVWMSHGDHVDVPPPGYRVTASQRQLADRGDRAHRAEPLFGVQFHPEVAHTPRGGEILNNFLFEICGCAPDWTPGHFVETEVARIRELVGPDQRVICGLSGGVDSLGRGGAGAPRGRRPAHLHLRGSRPAPPARARAGRGHVPPPPGHRPPGGGRERPLPRAPGRRRRSGGEAAAHRPHVHRRVRGRGEGGRQGRGRSWCRARSIPTSSSRSRPRAGRRSRSRPTTTSAACRSACRSSCSSRCASCSRTRCGRWGASWACRRRWWAATRSRAPASPSGSLGEVTRENLDVLRRADHIYIEEIRAAGLYDDIWQAFAVLLPIRSVGVQGDFRTYDQVIALRAVTSRDGMTADWFPFPPDVLGRDLQPDRQRSERRQPRGVRRQLQAARHDRVGVS